jgi:hypothetical protein
MEGNTDLKSDVSAEDNEKREDMDEILPKMSLIFRLRFIISLK